MLQTDNSRANYVEFQRYFLVFILFIASWQGILFEHLFLDLVLCNNILFFHVYIIDKYTLPNVCGIICGSRAQSNGTMIPSDLDFFFFR